MDPAGAFHSLKLLSRSSFYDEASMEGIRKILGLQPHESLPEHDIKGIRFGTTVATNALLERKGGNVALLITKGFRDLLEIGYQNRPHIFQLCIEKPSLLYSLVTEVEERIDAGGRVVKKVDETALTAQIQKIKDAGVDACAVVLLHSWINPEHECACERVLRDNGFANVFLSHRSVNLVKVVSRGQSTLLDAYLSIVLARYIDSIKSQTGTIPLEFMQSSGMLAPSGSFMGKNAVLSGPAGGVVAVAGIAADKNIRGAIGFDMGGTSTDVSRYDGDFQKRYDQVIAGIPLQIEMLDIHTVAAGGGSILSFDGQKMSAGPESAGADPGPACYGTGGPLTVSDANLITGRIIPEYFPKTFGTDGRSALHSETVRHAFQNLTLEINHTMGTAYSPEETANGFLRIANEKMSLAIKEISVSRGFDARDYALVCFGGAGGQHACAIARQLDIKTIIIHPLSSLMSAYGIGMTRPAWKTARSVLRPYNRTVHEEMPGLFDEMERHLRSGASTDNGHMVKREIDLRPEGTDSSLSMAYGAYEETVRAFRKRYRSLYGFSITETPLEIVNVKIELTESSDFFSSFREGERQIREMPKPRSFHHIYFAASPHRVPVYLRDTLPLHSVMQGPVVIIDHNSTVIVEPDFEAEMDEHGHIIISVQSERPAGPGTRAGNPDPVLLEVFSNMFMGISHEMGHTLRNTASSVNMKERLDFSCAVFDASGNLVANAPHIPVHLGSMADTVKAVIEANGASMRPGDAYLTNNPYKGGSHLPDMTVVSPVFSDSGDMLFCTAARGHHADVGGTTPGSMPPEASHIDEEGVLLDNFLLVRDGIMREDALKDLLAGHRYPARNIQERMHDFRAQVAACHKGAKELQRVITRHGTDMVLRYMKYIQDNSGYAVKKALGQFLDTGGSFQSSFEDHLDDGTPIKVNIAVTQGGNPPETIRAVIDFSGSGAQHVHSNLNAPFAVSRSAVLYVLRALTGRDIPLNSGCLHAVEIIIPSGTILHPEYPVPVASGNVETSQRIVDALLGAFGISAASQGTMNNLLFEVEGEHPYYETIAGGAGAMDGCPGASGVQVHMTNTRITDPEILEVRHPAVRLETFTLRRNSGGKGEYFGGDGVIRELRFLKPATVSIISERRVYSPYGAKGGDAGKKGLNLLKKADGETRALKHRDVLKAETGDSIVIKTPGGGGYGKPRV
jgi:5-oxoprolinase (ATP-hydrolysing)